MDIAPKAVQATVPGSTGPLVTTAENQDDAAYLNAVEYAIASGSVELMMYLVQLERVRLLDAQLVQQMKEVHENNKKIEKFNDVLNRMNAMLARIDGNEAKSKVSGWTKKEVAELEAPLNAAIKEAGIEDLGFSYKSGQRTPLAGETPEAGNQGVLILGTNVFSENTTKGELDAAITKVRSLIDAAANTQTLQMQRMQLLSNRKSEAHETINSNESKRHQTANSILNK